MLRVVLFDADQPMLLQFALQITNPAKEILKMNHQIIEAVYRAGPSLKSRGFSPTDRAVLNALAYRLATGCHPTKETLSADSGFSLTSVSRSLTWLSHEGIIEMRKRPPAEGDILYTIFF
jgi:hypothetical protein